MRCPVECRENAEWLLDYCSRRLDAAKAAVLEKHMEVCPACRAFRDGQQTVWRALDAWEAMPVSGDFDRRLYRRIDTESQRSLWDRLMQPLRPMFVRPAFPLAAACLVVVAGFLIEQNPALLAPPAQPSQIQAESIEAEQVERALEDIDMLRQLNVVPPGSERQAL